MEPRQRELVKAKLYPFIEWAWPMIETNTFVSGWHVGLMCDYLEAFTAGDFYPKNKLLINIPPGHQKSLTVSVFWPVWCWITRPELRFMFTSYRGELARRDALRAREILRNEEFQKVFPHIQVLRDRDTAKRYENTAHGYRFSDSVAGIMGEGGDYVTLDDPHNVEVAESDEVRDETVRKINLALPTRVRSPSGGVVVIMQRLHQRDYAGRLIAEQFEDLIHLCLPGRFEVDHPYRTFSFGRGKDRAPVGGDPRKEDGALLWPALFDETRLGSLERTMGEYGRAGQIQQRPTPREGGIFKRAWFQGKIVEEAPQGGVLCRGWDLAASTEHGAAWTAGVRMRLFEGRIYIEHASRFRGTPGTVVARMIAARDSDGKECIVDFPQDPGQAGKSQARDLRRKLQEGGYIARFSPESGDKVTRAEALAAAAEAGDVYLVEGSWVEPYLEELCVFPMGEFADQVDASSRAYHRVVTPRPTGGLAGPRLIEAT